MEKNSFWKALSWVAPIAGTAGATTYTMDRLANPDKEFLKDWDTQRIATAGINALLGAGAGASGRLSAGLFRKGVMNPAKLAKELGVDTAAAAASQGGSLTGAAAALTGGAGLIGLAPAKDLLINAQHLPHKIDKVLDATHTEIKNKPTVQNNLYDLAKEHGTALKWIGGGALGLGAAGLLAKLLSKKEEKDDVGRIRYRIPGKNGDPATEAIVELPLDTAKLSPTMLENIETNIKRQAARNIRANMRKRDPQTGKLIYMDEYERKYGRGAIKSASAEVEVGQTGKPAPFASKVYTSETPSIEQAFRQVRAGLGFYDNGATVKYASRAFHEGAGSLATGLASAAGGAFLGNKLYDKNPLLGAIAGGLTGAALPALLGKLTSAVQETDRTAEDQEAHDKETPGAEYLIPGYANYQHERRKKVKKENMTHQIAGASFAAVGMNPLLPSQGVSLEDAAESDMNKVEEEADADWAQDDSFDSLSKYASAPPPGPGGPPPGPQKDPEGINVAPAGKDPNGATTNKQLTAAVNANDNKPRLTDRRDNKLTARVGNITNRINQMAQS